MASFEVTGPDGSIYDIEAPEGTPDAVVLNFVRQQLALESGGAEEDSFATRRKELEAERDRLLLEAEKESTTALGRGFSRGIDVAGRGFGSALEGAGKVIGAEGLEAYGAEMIAENEAQLAEQEAMATRLKDVEGVNTTVDFALEALGETAPQTGLSLAAGAAAGAAAGSVVPGIGNIVGGLAGAALSQLPFFYGNNREAQKEAIEQGLRVEMSESAALLNALPQVALDAFAERLMVGKLLPTQKAIRSGGLLTRLAKGAGSGVAVEVPTELGQSLIERAQAGLELDSEEAIDGYIETAVVAGLIGGTLGGGAAGISSRTDVEPEPTPPPTQIEEQGELLEADAEAEALTDEQLAALPASARPAQEGTGAKDLSASLETMIGTLLAEGKSREEAETLAVADLADQRKISVENILDQVALEVKGSVEAIDVPQLLDSGKPEEEYTDAEIEAVRGYLYGTDTGVALTDDLFSMPAVKEIGFDRSREEVDPEFADLFVGAADEKQAAGQAKLREEIKNKPIEAARKQAERDAQLEELAAVDAAAQEVAATQNQESQQVLDDQQKLESARETAAETRRRSMPVAFKSETSQEAIRKGKPLEVTPEGVARTDDEAQGLTAFGRAIDDRLAEGVDKARQQEILAERKVGLDRKEGIRSAKERREAEEFSKQEGDLFPAARMAEERAPLTAGQIAALPASARPAVAEGEVAPEKPKKVTKKFLNALGIAEQAGIRKRLEGKEVNDAALRTQLTGYANLKSTSNQTKTAINNFLSAPAESSIYTQIPNTGGQLAFDLPRAKPRPAAKPKEAAVAKPTAKPKKAVVKPAAPTTPTDAAVEVTPEVAPAVTPAVNITKNPTIASQQAVNAEGVVKGFAVLSPDKKQPTTFYTSRKAAERNSKNKKDSQVVETATLNLAGDQTTFVRTGLARATPVTKEAAPTTKKSSVSSGERVSKNAAKKPAAKKPAAKAAAKPAVKPAAKTDVDKAAVDEAATRKKAFDAAVDRVYQDKVRNAGGEANLEVAELTTLRKAALRDVRARGSLFNTQTQFDPDLDAPLDNNVVKNIKEGNLKGALTALAYAADNPRVAKIASQLTKFVGDTRVVIVPAKPTDALGKRYRAALDEEPNTKGAFIYSDADPAIDNVILLDENTGVTAHNLLHEMSHAATIQELRNPSSPVTKQLTNLYNEVKGALSGYYGTQSVEEFVAEVFGNYKFRQELASIPIDKGTTTGLARVLDIMKTFLRRVFGIPSDAAGTADKLIESILAPYAGVRGSGTLYNASTMGKAKEFFADVFESFKPFGEDGKASVKSAMLSPVPDKAKLFGLGLLDLNALTDMSKERIPGVDRLLELVRLQSGTLNELTQKAKILSDELTIWAKGDLKRAELFSKTTTRSTFLRVDPSLTEAEARKRYIDPQVVEAIYQTKLRSRGGAANTTSEQDTSLRAAALQEATNAGKTDLEKLAAWKELRKDYTALGADGQRLYKTWRNAYRSMYDKILDVLDARLTEDIPDGAARKKVVNELYAKLADNGVVDPYFPLLRTGKFWLEYNAIDPDTGNVEYYVEAFATRAERRDATKEVRSHWMEPKGKHKVTIEAQITAAMKSPNIKTRAEAVDSISGVNAFSNIKKANYKNAPSTSFVNNTLNVLQANNVGEEVQEQVMRLFLDSLPERSFANSFRHRKDTRGFIADVTPIQRQIPTFDVIKGLQSRALNVSHQLAQLQYGGDIRAYASKLEKDLALINKDSSIPREERDLTMLLGEELAQRASWAASPNVEEWAKFFTSIGFNATLGFNISSALVNLSQLPMVAVPYLGGKYGDTFTDGISKASKAMGNATRLILNSGLERTVETYGPELGKDVTKKKGALWGLDNYDYNDPNLPSHIAMYKTLVVQAKNLGQLNKSMIQAVLDLDNIDAPMAKINAVSGFVFHHTEQFNRQVTMAMAYDLGMQKKLKDKNLGPNDWNRLDQSDLDAIAFEAINDTELTNGGIAASAAPRWAQHGVGKVVFLFKRYASSMYYLLSKLTRDSIVSKDPAMKAMARRQLAGVFGGAGLVSGLQGLPLFGTLAFVHNLFQEDDEEDFETGVRKYFGEGMYGGLGNFVLGVDVAGRMGLSNLVFRDRLIEKDQSILWTVGEMFGGPVIGYGLQVERGLNLIADDELARGIEAMSPAALRNVIKAVRFSSDGAKNLRGDSIVEDIHGGHLFAQAVGFAPAAYTQQLQKNSAETKVSRSVSEEKTKLLRRYYKFLRDGDSLGMQEIQGDMINFNARHPEVGITPKTIKKSMAMHIKTTAETVNGIRVAPRRLALAQESMGEWDDTLTVWQAMGL